MASVTMNGNTYTDDSHPTTGLAGGGHRTRFVPLCADVVVVAAGAESARSSAASSAGTATTQAGIATAGANTSTAQAGIAATQASAATAQAGHAATWAGQAQTYRNEAAGFVAQAEMSGPIRLQAQAASSDFTVPTDYHALSIGPLTVATGVIVTVQSGSTWAIL
jgi:hypothetical protein